MLKETQTARDNISNTLRYMEPVGKAFWAHLSTWEKYDNLVQRERQEKKDAAHGKARSGKSVNQIATTVYTFAGENAN